MKKILVLAVLVGVVACAAPGPADLQPSTAIYGARVGGVPYISQLLEVRDTDKLGVIGDSVSAGTPVAWWHPLRNYAATRYTNGPTWVLRAQSGANLLALRSAQVPGLIADQPQVVFIECENEYVTNSTATTQARMEAVIDDIKTGVPGLRWCGILGPWAGTSEKWNPPDATVEARLQKVVTAYRNAAASRNCTYIDTHNTQQVAESRYNPTNATSGITTNDGLHPTPAGNDLIAQTVSRYIYWRGAGPEQSDSWTPAQLATPPTMVLDPADLALSDGAAISTFGSGCTFTATSTERPTFVASAAAFGGQPVARFNGSTNVMRSASCPISGAKTVFVVYRVTSLPASNQFVSLITVRDATKLFEFVPSYNSVVLQKAMFLDDVTGNGSINPPGTGAIYTTDVYRLGHTYNGGSSTSTGSYANYDGFGQLSIGLGGGGFGHVVSDTMSSIGARLNAAGAGSNYMAGDLAYLLIAPSVMGPADRAQVDWYLRRRFRNPIPMTP